MPALQAGRVRRSLQRFRDLARDLETADVSTFQDRLGLFVHFCSTDEVFSRVHEQMINLPGADVDALLQSDDGGWLNNSLRFPTDTDARISVMYRLILAINSDQVDFVSLMVERFAVGPEFDDMIATFANAILGPMLRELDYKLQEIEDELPDGRGEAVSPAIFQVIHAHGPFLQQQALGNGNSQTATLSPESQSLIQLVSQLRQKIEVSDLDNDQKATAVAIADTLHLHVSTGSASGAVIRALVAALPPVADIASIASAIATFVR
jgi:hypothetical protein